MTHHPDQSPPFQEQHSQFLLRELVLLYEIAYNYRDINLILVVGEGPEKFKEGYGLGLG